MDADRYIDVLGARVRYRAAGRGPAVLLLHGLGASLESWAWTVPALQKRFTTIAFDFPGFGLSDPLPTAYTPDGAAAATLALMDALGIRAAVLVGSSLGGGIAAMTAGLAPRRCRALVLAAPGGFDRRVSAATRLASLGGLGEVIVWAIGLAPILGVRNTFARRRIPPALLEAVRRSFRQGAAGPTCLRTLRTLVTLGGVRPAVVSRVRTVAARISAPTLVVWGTRDRVIPAGQAAVVVRTIPGARLHRLEGIGHAPFIEDADAFNAVLTGFLDAVSHPIAAGAEP